MARTQVKLNTKGVQTFLKQDMQPILKERGSKLLSILPEGYESEIYVGKNRANCTVRATDPKAIQENNKSNTLIKSLYSI